MVSLHAHFVNFIDVHICINHIRGTTAMIAPATFTHHPGLCVNFVCAFVSMCVCVFVCVCVCVC